MADAGRIKAVTARAAHRSHVDDANAESTVSGMHGLAEATEVPAQGVMQITLKSGVVVKGGGRVRLGWGAKLKAKA